MSDDQQSTPDNIADVLTKIDALCASLSAIGVGQAVDDLTLKAKQLPDNPLIQKRYSANAFSISSNALFGAKAATGEKGKPVATGSHFGVFMHNWAGQAERIQECLREIKENPIAARAVLTKLLEIGYDDRPDRRFDRFSAEFMEHAKPILHMGIDLANSMVMLNDAGPRRRALHP
jgi:hypothetical protein